MKKRKSKDDRWTDRQNKLTRPRIPRQISTNQRPRPRQPLLLTKPTPLARRMRVRGFKQDFLQRHAPLDVQEQQLLEIYRADPFGLHIGDAGQGVCEEVRGCGYG